MFYKKNTVLFTSHTILLTPNTEKIYMLYMYREHLLCLQSSAKGTIMDIIFSDFLILYQLFFSQSEAKRDY